VGDCSPQRTLLSLVMKVRELIALLKREGWVEVRQRGSHRQFKKAGNRWLLTVAGKLGSDVPTGTLHDILTKAGLI